MVECSCWWCGQEAKLAERTKAERQHDIWGTTDEGDDKAPNFTIHQEWIDKMNGESEED